MIGAALGWAIYSIFLINWKSNFSIMARFTLIAFFGAMSLFPFYFIEEVYLSSTFFNTNFLFLDIFCSYFSWNNCFYSLYESTKICWGLFSRFYFIFFAIYSAIYGIVLFDEKLMLFHYYGAAFVFIWCLYCKKFN